jgi:nicotinamidase-related amidase
VRTTGGVVANAHGRDDVIANINTLVDRARAEQVLVVTGAQTDACIRATLHGAFVRGYDTLLVSDAHTTDDFSEYGLPPADKVIAHTNMYWTWQDGPDRVATVVDAAAVDFTTEEASA